MSFRNSQINDIRGISCWLSSISVNYICNYRPETNLALCQKQATSFVNTICINWLSWSFLSFLSENTEQTQNWETDRPLMYSSLSLLWEQSKLEFPVFISCFVLFPVNLTLKTDFRGEKLLDDKTVFVQHESGIGNLFVRLLSPFPDFWSFLAHGVFLCTQL